MNSFKSIGGGVKPSRLYVTLICIALLTGLLMAATFSYFDTSSLTAWSLNFWDLFFKGRLDEFYEYAALNLRGARHVNCAGNYLWLLPLCIWNFPLWVIHSLAGIMSIRNFYSILWTKLFFMLMQYIMAYFAAKICYMLTKNKDRAVITVILLVLSPEILMSTGYAGQDEIVYICFFVLALYCYLKGYWKRCYLLMLCSVTCCPIMLIPVLALLFLKEKNIYKLGLEGAFLVLPLLVFEILYRHDAIYQVVKEDNGFAGIIEGMLLTSKVTLSGNTVSISGVLLCVIFFICYITRQEEDDVYKRKVIYLCAAVFGIISFLMTNRFYRMFLYVPFLVLLIMTSVQDLRMNLLLYTVVTYGRTYYSLMAEYPHNMNTSHIMENSWITKLCDLAGSDVYLPSSDRYEVCLWTRFHESSTVYHMVVATCVFGAMVLLLVINHTKYKYNHEIALSDKLTLTVCVMCMPVILAAFYILLLL